MGNGGFPGSLVQRVGLVTAAALLVAGLVTALLALSGGSGSGRSTARSIGSLSRSSGTSPSAASRPVIRLLAQDVDVSAASGSFDSVDTSTISSPGCPNGSVASGGGVSGCRPTLPVTTSHGVVNTKPFAMMAVSNDGPLGTITLYDNGTDVWELGGGDYGLGPGTGNYGSGAPLSGFAASVEGTLGQEAGAIQMQSVAGGGATFELETQEIQGAAPAGTGTVDGVPVTIYKLFTSGLQDPNLPGLTPEEVTTIQQANAILQAAGFQGKTTWVSVDADGYILEQVTTYALADGTTVHIDSVYSNFGCAGTVLMPGQTGNSAPPAGCVSPDQAGPGTPVTTAPTTTTSPSSVPWPSSPTTVLSPPTTSEVPPASSPTTTGPQSGPVAK